MFRQCWCVLTVYSKLLKNAVKLPEQQRNTGAYTHTQTPFSLVHMHTHGLLHPLITLSHPGPPSDINISVIKPKETPAFSMSKFRLEGELHTERKVWSQQVMKIASLFIYFLQTLLACQGREGGRECREKSRRDQGDNRGRRSRGGDEGEGGSSGGWRGGRRRPDLHFPVSSSSGEKEQDEVGGVSRDPAGWDWLHLRGGGKTVIKFIEQYNHSVKHG